MRDGGGSFAMRGDNRFDGGRTFRNDSARFARHDGRFDHRFDHRDNRFARFDRDDRFRHHRFVRNNVFFFGDGGWGWGWDDYAYGGCWIGYNGLTYCPPYY
jgi:hypothetical protein